MRSLKVEAAALFALALAGCSGAKAPDTQARAIALGTVETLETVWMTAAKACMDVAEAKNDENLAGECATYLKPARNSIVAAASAVDVWDDAAQSNFPCLIADAMAGVDEGLGVATTAGFKPPQVVSDGRALASQYVPLCVRDAGGGQ